MINDKEFSTAPDVSQRVLKWDGTRNTRELGGYLTKSGRNVRWRRLFRSDHLHNLSTADQASFLALDLYAIIDLRSPAERDEAPSKLPTTGTFQRIELPVYDADRPDDIAAIGAKIRRGRLEDIEPTSYLLASNRAYARHHAAAFGDLVQVLLAAAGRPVFFHCTAGKDRTGFAAAVILSLLGVSPALIMADYLLTNRLLAEQQTPFLRRYAERFGAGAAAKIETLFTVQAQFLQEAFATIDAEYGSFTGYARSALGIGEADQEKLQRLYLAE